LVPCFKIKKMQGPNPVRFLKLRFLVHEVPLYRDTLPIPPPYDSPSHSVEYENFVEAGCGGVV